MARRGYPPEFSRRIVELVEGGRKASEVAPEFEASDQTIYTWRRQARIDAGLEAGARRTRDGSGRSHGRRTAPEGG
jgi:transposase-like protein